LLSKGNSNDSEKIKKGAVNQAYQSTGGVTSVDSNYGPQFFKKAVKDKAQAQTRNRSQSSLSNRSKKLISSLIDLKNKMSDDHNIYHYKSSSKQGSIDLRSRRSGKLREFLKSATQVRR